jgi:hypothetical protein
MPPSLATGQFSRRPRNQAGLGLASSLRGKDLIARRAFIHLRPAG